MSKVNYDEICNLIALEVGHNASPQSVKRYLRATYKVILSQLFLNNKIYFDNFGCFEIKDRKSGDRVIGNPENGGKQLIYVRPRKSITFKPSQIFDVSVNENNFKIAKNLKKKEKSRREKSFDKSIVNAFNKAVERSK